jgi:hypothetical protein
MVAQCGDGGQRVERKTRGQSRLEESCEGCQSPPRVVVLLMIIIICKKTLMARSKYIRN